VKNSEMCIFKHFGVFAILQIQSKYKAVCTTVLNLIHVQNNNTLYCKIIGFMIY